MPIYGLVPTAPAEDPRWQNFIFQGDLLVRAPNASEARDVAALEEARIALNTLPPSSTQGVASAFHDVSLYAVTEDVSGRFSAVGPARVLMGSLAPPQPHRNPETPALKLCGPPPISKM